MSGAFRREAPALPLCFATPDARQEQGPFHSPGAGIFADIAEKEALVLNRDSSIHTQSERK